MLLLENLATAVQASSALATAVEQVGTTKSNVRFRIAEFGQYRERGNRSTGDRAQCRGGKALHEAALVGPSLAAFVADTRVVRGDLLVKLRALGAQFGCLPHRGASLRDSADRHLDAAFIRLAFAVVWSGVEAPPNRRFPTMQWWS